MMISQCPCGPSRMGILDVVVLVAVALFIMVMIHGANKKKEKYPEEQNESQEL